VQSEGQRREVGKHRQSQFLGSALSSILREKTLHHLGTWAAQNHSPFPYMSLLQPRCRYGEMTLAQIHPVSNISMLSYFLLLLHDRKDLLFLFLYLFLPRCNRSQVNPLQAVQFYIKHWNIHWNKQSAWKRIYSIGVRALSRQGQSLSANTFSNEYLIIYTKLNSCNERRRELLPNGLELFPEIMRGKCF